MLRRSRKAKDESPQGLPEHQEAGPSALASGESSRSVPEPADSGQPAPDSMQSVPEPVDPGHAATESSEWGAAAVVTDRLGQAVAGLRSVIGEEQLDLRARVTMLEERIGVLEHLLGQLVANGEDSGGPPRRSRAVPAPTGRRKKAKRLAAARDGAGRRAQPGGKKAARERRIADPPEQLDEQVEAGEGDA